MLGHDGLVDVGALALLGTAGAEGAGAEAAHAGPPAFLVQLTLLLIVSAAAAYGSFRLRLLPIIGFLLAGCWWVPARWASSGIRS